MSTTVTSSDATRTRAAPIVAGRGRRAWKKWTVDTAAGTASDQEDPYRQQGQEPPDLARPAARYLLPLEADAALPAHIPVGHVWMCTGDTGKLRLLRQDELQVGLELLEVKVG